MKFVKDKEGKEYVRILPMEDWCDKVILERDRIRISGVTSGITSSEKLIMENEGRMVQVVSTEIGIKSRHEIYCVRGFASSSKFKVYDIMCFNENVSVDIFDDKDFEI